MSAGRACCWPCASSLRFPHGVWSYQAGVRRSHCVPQQRIPARQGARSVSPLPCSQPLTWCVRVAGHQVRRAAQAILRERHQEPGGIAQARSTATQAALVAYRLSSWTAARCTRPWSRTASRLRATSMPCGVYPSAGCLPLILLCAARSPEKDKENLRLKELENASKPPKGAAHCC